MALEGSYNYYIVALSVLIAILASYSSLSIAGKISLSGGRTRYFWLLAGALVMGSGVWSMHFIGMLAFHLHASVHYDVWLTLLSMGASIAASFIAFYITMPKDVKVYHIVIGGFTMGSGIVAMHYIGMSAMVMSVSVSYDPVMWTLSALIALAASYAALYLFLRFRNESSSIVLKWLSAIVMGFAICGMHYTGMAAAKFEIDTPLMANHDESIQFFLLFGVTVVIFVIFMVYWAAMYLDRHVLEKMAYQDTLTGLPNRNEMNRFFNTYMRQDTIGVLFLDLDRFKIINDTLGHHVGDLLVQEVGRRLRGLINSEQMAFRIGGDEFLFIVKNCDEERAKSLAQEILQRIKEVYLIEGNEFYITGSVGISIGSMQLSDRSKLLKNADTAMYKAKGTGKNQYCVYTEEMGKKAVRKMEIEKDLQCALEQQQLFLVYQPKWNVRTNRLSGLEALIRWNHPSLGLIMPSEFITVAEETGAIIPMTRWVLREACRQCKEWQSQGVYEPVSVNMSSKMFQSGYLTDWVKETLVDNELDPSYLELEITESMLLYDIQDIIRQLQHIRQLGVKVSMDDFGTGYSSIGLLDRIPINTLKLDRLFTDDLNTPSKRAIIQAVILMAEKLQLDVIAEGVENQAHIDSLTELGCYVMQGYYYGKPMKSEEIGVWLHAGRTDNSTTGIK